MEQNIKVWVLLAAITAMTSILGFVINISANQAIKKMDEIVDQLKKLCMSDAVHDTKIKTLEEDNNKVNTRLDHHDSRIREMEMHIKPQKRHVET